MAVSFVFLLVFGITNVVCADVGEIDLNEVLPLLISQNQLLIKENQQLKKTVAKLVARVGKLEAKEHNVMQPKRREVDGPVTFTYTLASIVSSVPGNAAIPFHHRITDIGGGYDNSTGVFTAPREGIYMFSCTLLADHAVTSNPMLHASIMVDGVSVAKVFAVADRGNHRDQGANTVFVHLKGSSRVWVKALESAHVHVGGDNYSTFSGFLLWPY